MKLNESLSFQKVLQKESLSSLLKNSRAPIAAAALGVLAAACGGKAVIDDTRASGQGGTAGSENIGGTGGEGGNPGGSGGIGGEVEMGGFGGMECPDGVGGQGANGNIDTAVVVVDSSATPLSSTYFSGENNAVLMAFDLHSHAQEPMTLKVLTVQGYTDCDTEGSFSTNPDTLCYCPSEENSSALEGITYNLSQYVNGVLIGIENANSLDAAIIFNDLTVTLDPQSTTRIEIRGTINNAAPDGDLDDRLKLGVTKPSSLVLEDTDGLTLGTDLVYVTEGAQNGGTADEGVIMTITE